MTVSHKWEELTSAQLTDRLAADPDCVALIPVGATEQHGPHLPVGTDTIIATALADAAAGDVAVVLPPLAFGASFFHGTRLTGTVAFSGEETAATASLVAEACVDSGFRRLLFVNGHVGNAAALWIACDRFRREFPDRRIGVVQWWDLTPDIARRATEDAADFVAAAERWKRRNIAILCDGNDWWRPTRKTEKKRGDERMVEPHRLGESEIDPLVKRTFENCSRQGLVDLDILRCQTGVADSVCASAHADRELWNP